MDEIRGLCVLLMIFITPFYTMSMLFHWELGTKLLVFFSPAEPFSPGFYPHFRNFQPAFPQQSDPRPEASGRGSGADPGDLFYHSQRADRIRDPAYAVGLHDRLRPGAEAFGTGFPDLGPGRLRGAFLNHHAGIRRIPRPARHSGVENSSRVVRIRLAVPSGHPSRRFLFRRLFPSVPLDLSLFLRHLHRPLGQNGKFPDFTYRLRFIPELDGPPRPDFISYSPAADLRRVHFNFLDHFPLAGLAPRLARDCNYIVTYC